MMRTAQLPDRFLSGLTDTHCHLEDAAFAADRADVVERIRRAGMIRVLLAGTDLADSQAAALLAKEHSDVLRFAAGLHPQEASLWDAALCDGFRELLRMPGAVAVGEIGLDYYRNLSPREDQLRAFREQLALAQEMQLPVIVHIREAADDALALLAEAALARGGVWHAFSGEISQAKRALDLGFFLGAAGPVTYPKASTLRAVFRSIPLERILVETDAPYLPPEGNRGKRNEPVLVQETILRLAADRELPPEEAAAIFRQNANHLFAWE
jgi:TatD DNase family protein